MTRLVLVGGGHAHAQVLRDWIAAPPAGCELVLVTPSALAPYSGMVPGWLAGHYRHDEICIDFAALAAAAGAALRLDDVVALDAGQRMLQLAGGERLRYDLLSLNIGSTLTPPAMPADVRVLSMRPLAELRRGWEALLADPALALPGARWRITMVGGGAAGVESILAACARLRALQPGLQLAPQLLTRGDRLLPGMAAGAARRAAAALEAAGVAVRLNTDFKPPPASGRPVESGAAGGPADATTELLLWATGAESQRWPRGSGLDCDDRGFIRVGADLRSTSHPDVFAVGDCASWSPPLPKAGVFAVRMGPVLSRNLRAALQRQPGTTYSPQRRYLALLSTADGRAIGAWGPLALEGAWLWRWKDHIDRGFLRRFASPAVFGVFAEDR